MFKDDIYNVKYEELVKNSEKEIKNIPGVIEVGIFAVDKPQLVIVGEEDGYNSIES